ncbi:MAG: heme exporter protein CcmB [Methanophagales archaeon]|nr:heme exporter protein CcmB [Methanophagales archaeon]
MNVDNRQKGKGKGNRSLFPIWLFPISLFLQAAFRIAEKDLRTEFRRSYEVLSILSFSVGSILICSFAWSVGSVGSEPEVAAAALWIIIFFASILAFTTSFTREADSGTLGGLKTLPCSPLAILFGKIIYGIVLLFLVECVLIPFSIIFLNLDLSGRFPALLLVCLLGAVGLSFAGSFVSGLVMFSEGKTLLLSFLLIPVCMPVLLPSVVATKEIIGGSGIDEVMPEVMLALKLLIAFLFLITAIMILTFEFVLEE